MLKERFYMWLLGTEKYTKRDSFVTFPLALKKTILVRGALSLILAAIFAFVAYYTTTMTQLVGVIVTGVIVFLVMAFITYITYITAAARNYTIYEGVCTVNTFDGDTVTKKAWNMTKSQRKLQFDGYDGKAYAVVFKEGMITGRMMSRPGYGVRVYAPKNSQPSLRNGEFYLDRYLAIESTGERKITAS